MRPVTLNLATRPFRNNAVVGSVLSAMALAGLLATGYNVYVWGSYSGSYADLVQRERDDTGRLAGLEAEEKSLAKEIQARDFKGLYERGRLANDIILKRAFSWTQLFNKLEEVVPAEVRATSIRPNIGNEGIQIHIVGEAKHPGAWLALQDRLQHDPSFSAVAPQNERRLNPSRPEITFALRFDYLPRRPGPAPAAPALASAASPAAGPERPAGPPAAPSAPAGQAPAASAPATATTARASATSSAARDAGPPAATPAPGRGTVGRDGRPRDAALMAQVLAAPGGIYPAPPAAPPAPPSGRDSKGRAPGQARPAGSGQAPAAAPATGPGGAVRGDPGGPPGAAAASGPAASGPTIPAGPALPAAPREPAGGTEPRSAGGPGTATAAPVVAADRAAPATRLDLRLRFNGRPVGEIYEALSRAHGVRVQLDPGVDAQARVTADLSGRALADALAAVAQAAGHRVTRKGDGVYRVAATAGGEPIADRPVREEDLRGPEVSP